MPEVVSANTNLDYESFWDGLDETNEFKEKFTDFNVNVYKQKAKVFVLLGPEDSGTHLMQHLVETNFPDMISSQRDDGEIWKHSNSGAENIYKVLSKNMKSQTIKETTAVMMIRSPLSQIVSWKSHPYDMSGCVNRPYKKMNERCQSGLSACPPAHPELHYQVSFNSTIDVYNHYLREYRQIVADKRFDNARIFTYEDVVQSTEEVIRDLAKLFKKPMPNALYVANANSKDGRTNYRMKAQAKIKNRLYLSQIDKAEQKIMCEGLDYNIADTITEGSYLRESSIERKAHSYDCKQT